MNTQEQVEHALKVVKDITTLDHSQLTKEQKVAIRDIDHLAYDWLTYQQTIIFQQKAEITELKRGVPTGEYMVLSDGVEVEIYKDPLIVIAELRAEIERLKANTKKCKHDVDVDWICIECIDEEIERERG